MSMEQLFLKNRDLHDVLVLFARIWDDRNLPSQDIAVLKHDFEALQKMGIHYVGVHKIVCGPKKFRRSRKPKESLF